jgi:hypothetical protein
MKRRKASRSSDTPPAAIIQATRLYSENLNGFGCEAVHYVAVNDHFGTVTHANVYKGKLPTGFNVGLSTYPINDRKLSRRVVKMVELEVTDWPEFVQVAIKVSKRGRGVRS